MGFALLAGYGGSRDPSPVHQLLMSQNPPKEIRLSLMVLHSPSPLGHRARPDPNLRMMRIEITNLRPQRNHNSHNIGPILKPTDLPSKINLINVQPCGKPMVRHP